MTDTTDSGQCPGGGESVYTVHAIDHRLHSYAEVGEALRSRSLAPLLSDGTEAFRKGTLRQIDGVAHRVRRRTLGTLLNGEGGAWFRERVLHPTIRRGLDAVLANPNPDGLARTDMVVLVRNAFFQFAAALIGLTDVHGDDAADSLRLSCLPINTAMSSAYRTGDRAAMLAAGLAAKENFKDRYFTPALGTHRQMFDAVERGECRREDLPHDFLSLIVQGTDPTLSGDLDLSLREVLADVINAGTVSSTFNLIHVLNECLCWFDQHPEDRTLCTDEEFLLGAVNEGLRLHPVVPMFYRIATTDITLRTGRAIKEGETVGIDLRPANRDPHVFGETADRFDPRRAVPPAVHPYGLAFGSGRHVCYGLPVIFGDSGTNGSHVQMLAAFFEAGIAFDPARPPRPGTGVGALAVWESFPVVFHNANRS